jgi:hypothetical protein
MKNLFTFGCSHTNHNYPTWANILGEQFENHYNFGKGGSGVFYSFYQMISVIQNKEDWNITEDDYFVWLVTEENRQDFIMHHKDAEHWDTDSWYNNSRNWWTENYDKIMSPVDGLSKAYTYIYTIKELLEANNIKYKIILALSEDAFLTDVANYNEYKRDINEIIGEYTDLQILGYNAPKDDRHYYFLEDGELVFDGHFQIPIHIEFLRRNFDWFEEKNIEKYLKIHDKCKSGRYSPTEIYDQKFYEYPPNKFKDKRKPIIRIVNRMK